MFSKEENKQIKVDFYTQLGQKLKDHYPLSGEKVKWLNFKTGVKGINVKLDFSKREGKFWIEFNHQDEFVRDLFFDQMEEFKTILHAEMPEEGIWFRETFNDYGEPYAKIEWTLEKVSMYKKDTWEEAHKFFSQLLIGFDSFWSDVKSVFIDLNK